MNNQFDELAKNMAQSVTRRGALKKFGVGIAGIALAALGVTNEAQAGWRNCVQRCKNDCAKMYKRNSYGWEICWTGCAAGCPDIGV